MDAERRDALDCAAEPIRIPGAIQPHGALAVLDAGGLELRHRSANLAALTGLEVPLGAPLASSPGAESLVAELSRWAAARESALLQVVKVAGRDFQILAHRTAQGLVVEFEAPPADDGLTLTALYPRQRAFLEAVSQAPDLDAIARVAAAEVAVLTGFNRVMLYRFDEAGDGAVLAEMGDGVLPSYLGQRFPAADIPAQARELYRLNRLRLIPDAYYRPCPLEPAFTAAGEPIDLSQAALRSVSPVHLEYMRNMGTGASMSISILVDGELWGLISAHNAAPKGVNAQVRTACDMLGQVLSLQIEARLQANRTAERLRLKRHETDLLGRLAAEPDFVSGLARNPEIWMALAGAEGAAVITGDKVVSVGHAPDEPEIRRIAEALGAMGEPVFATDSMAGLWPWSEPFAARASGVLAVSISQIRPDYILWFRREAVRTIDWSGDPRKAVEAGQDRLHPRKSFALWREQVRLRSLAWRSTEVESAAEFRASIQSLVLRRAEERAELTERLERLNVELESFSYSISHDLRAPFRHIVGYAELLTDHASGLDEKGRHYLQSIVESGLAAGRLVDDLLQFSHLGRSALNTGDIDMGKLVAEARRTLEPDLAGREITWTVGDLPSAWGDGAMVRQLWLNLIQNAVKYSAGRDPATITIRGEDRGDHTFYAIRDTGAGFEMAYVSKLFGVFQRLHRAEEFEGTGIGLALVKRIVDRHGGEVTAWGEPGVGAEFTFTLPRRASGARPKGDDTRG